MGRRRVASWVVALATGIVLLGCSASPPRPPPIPPSPPTATITPGQTAAPSKPPTLVGWAALPAGYEAPGPPSGAKSTPANGRHGPYPHQVVPGFSAAALGPDGTLWGMPDNGFGNRRNSGDFLLRIYRLDPSWQTSAGGSGQVRVRGFVALADPRHQVRFPIVHRSGTRLLTGSDFDIESLQAMPDGTFWLGDEFGPYLLHVSATGALLAPPVPFWRGGSPQEPGRGDSTPVVARSGGIEALAASTDQRSLYPILEKALRGAHPRDRVISEFDLATGAYTQRRWTYRVDAPANSVADAQFAADGSLLVLERDDRDGAAARTKRIYRVRLGEPGVVAKSLVADLLTLADPARLGPGSGYGSGDPFAFAFRCVETLLVLPDGRLLIANDTNFPGDAARRPGRPDAAELIQVGLS